MMVLANGARMTAEFARYMRRLRLAAGFESADDVMRESKNRISAHAIRAIERGNVDRPKVETLEVLAEMYSVPLDDLLYHAGYLPAPLTGVNSDDAFIVLYRALPDEEKALAMVLMRRLLAASRLSGGEDREQTSA